MPYATETHLRDRYGDVSLLQLADRDRDGSADPAVIARALADADAEIDGYLAARYPVPVTPAPPRLTDLACSIAWFKLHAQGVAKDGPERMAYDDAVAYLVRVARGEVALPGVAAGAGGAGAPAAAAGSGAARSGAGRVFSRDSLRGL